MRILRKVKKEFDYLDYCEANFSVKYANNGELRVCCPKCDDSKWKCYVNNDMKRFNCFKCDFNSGNNDVFDFVAETEGMTREEAILRLTREYAEVAVNDEDWVDYWKSKGVEVEEEHHIPIKVIPHLPSSAKPLTDPADETEAPFWGYLRKRGFTDNDVTLTQAHYVAAEHVKIHNSKGFSVGDIGRRIIWPVHGGNYKLVSWLARATDDREPKYINAPETELSRTLWPYMPSRQNRAILVEGLIDALALRRHGFVAYCTFGKKLSNDQIKLLKAWNITEIVLFYDLDAKKEMKKAINTLKVHFDRVFVPNLSVWDPTKDPGDTLKDENPSMLKTMLTDFLIDVNSVEFITWNLI